MVINPGNFDKRIKIIKYEIKKDADGFEEKIENVVSITWAQVTNISGTEILRSNSDFSEVKTRFLMRTPKSFQTFKNALLRLGISPSVDVDQGSAFGNRDFLKKIE